MTTATLLLTWSLLALAASVSPGPDTLLVAGHGARGGRSAGLAAVAGIVAGGFWYMALVGLGFLSVLAAWPVLFSAVKIAGALYLAWLGTKLIVGAVRPQPVEAHKAVALSAPFRQGFVTNALNPKIALFYLAALPQFVGTGPDAPAIGVGLIAIHYAIGGVWLSLVALASARAGTVLRTGPAMRWIEGVLGAAFIGLAGKLAVSRS